MITVHHGSSIATRHGAVSTLFGCAGRVLSVLAVSGVLAFPASAQNPFQPPEKSEDPYRKIGDDASGFLRPRCHGSMFWTSLIPFFFKCEGNPSKSLSKAGEDDDALLRHLANEKNWETASVLSLRTPANPSLKDTSLWPHFRIQSIEDPHRIKLQELHRNGFITARITVDTNGNADKRYGIARTVSGGKVTRGSVFYLAVAGYDAIDTTERDSSRKVSNWYVYGIDSSGVKPRLVRVGNTGTFRWCRHVHEKPWDQKAAAFLTCSGYAEARALLQDSGVLAELRKARSASEGPRRGRNREDITWLIESARRLAAFTPPLLAAANVNPGVLNRLRAFVRRADDPGNPAWMPCGVGCCTADDLQI